MKAAVPLWVCDHCLGPAVWTIIRDEVYYHCERQCDGFSQLDLDLFGEEGVSPPTRGGEADEYHEKEEELRALPPGELPF